MLSAIPGRATFVSAHDELGGRWEELVKGGVGRSVARVDGLASADAYLEYGQAARLLASEKTVIAFVPGFTPYVKGRWVVSTWLGAKSHFFRWGLVETFVKGIRTATLPDHTPCWIYSKGTSTVVFAVRGGVLLAVCGDDLVLLQDMLCVLDASVGRRENINLERLSDAAQAFPDGKDVAWLQTPVSISSDGRALLSLKPQDTEVVLDLLLNMPVRGSGSLSMSVSEVSQVCGDLVDAIAVGKLETLTGFLAKTGKNPVLAFLSEIASDDSDVFVGVMQEEFSGKIYSIKVPVLLAGIRVKPDVDVTKKVYDLMDRLNAEKGLGIIPVKMPTETPYPIIVAGGSKMNLFGGIKERPALTVRDGWLILCSDMESLLGAMLATADRSPVECPRWARLLGKSDGLAGLYMDSAASEQAIRNAIAVYTLSLIADGEGTAEKRAQLDAVRGIVEGLADIGEPSAVLKPEGEGAVRISILLGSEEGL